MVACVALTTAGTSAVVAATNPTARANPKADGCNGYVELCMQRLNQIVWPGSHNAMSSSAYNFFGAEHTLSVPDQLNQGVKALLLDVYYGYPESGIVRTNLAGGISAAQIQQDYGKDAVDELNRVGALTGVADTSGSKKGPLLLPRPLRAGRGEGSHRAQAGSRVPTAQSDRRADPGFRGLCRAC